jgi:hypothetical protein
LPLQLMGVLFPDSSFFPARWALLALVIQKYNIFLFGGYSGGQIYATSKWSGEVLGLSEIEAYLDYTELWFLATIIWNAFNVITFGILVTVAERIARNGNNCV